MRTIVWRAEKWNEKECEGVMLFPPTFQPTGDTRQGREAAAGKGRVRKGRNIESL